MGGMGRMGDKSEINQAPRLEDVRGTRRKDNEVEGSSFEQELRPVPNSLSISTPHHFNSHFFSARDFDSAFLLLSLL